MIARRLNSWLLGLDLVVVLAFVAIGRDTHEEGTDLVDIVATAMPFLLATIAGWVVARALKSPIQLRTGAIVGLVTAILGLALRRLVFGDGTAVAFVIVATVFLVTGALGWRLIAGRVTDASSVSVQDSANR